MICLRADELRYNLQLAAQIYSLFIAEAGLLIQLPFFQLLDFLIRVIIVENYSRESIIYIK